MKKLTNDVTKKSKIELLEDFYKTEPRTNAFRYNFSHMLLNNFFTLLSRIRVLWLSFVHFFLNNISIISVRWSTMRHVPR
jgi:hypothetical protein